MPDEHAENTLPPDASPLSGKPPPMHTRWKKGHSGNPKGRPKGTGVTDRIKAILDQETKNGGTVADAMARAAIRAALGGDFRFWQEIVNRSDGKVPDQIQSETDGRVEIVHIRDPLPDGNSAEYQSTSSGTGEGDSGGEEV